eukprot:2482948-Rhodomonas_salina.1
MQSILLRSNLQTPPLFILPSFWRFALHLFGCMRDVYDGLYLRICGVFLPGSEDVNTKRFLALVSRMQSDDQKGTRQSTVKSAQQKIELIDGIIEGASDEHALKSK